MKKLLTSLFLVTFLLGPISFVFGQDSNTPPALTPPIQSTGGSQSPQQSRPPIPPMPSSNMPANVQTQQRDGANFQRDGADFQRDGSNFKPSMPPEMSPRPMNSPSLNSNNSNQKGNSGMDSQSSARDKQQERQQQAMNKRAGKQLALALKSVAKIQAKLKKSGFNLSADCQTVISDAGTLVNAITNGSSEIDQNDIGDTMQNLGECQMLGQQLSSVPTIYKTLSKAVLRFKKKNPDQNIDDAWNTVDKEFMTLKGGDFSQDDVFSFFDDAFSLAEDIGIDTRQFGPMPQGERSNQQGNLGASIMGGIKSFNSFFNKILSK